MKDRSLIGMWRFAITEKLRKRINKAATKLMCLKIDPKSEEEFTKTYCGTSPLNEDCPFFVSTRLPDRNEHCLASDFAKCGCYISTFCELGLSNYNRILRWRKRFARSRTFEMASQRYFQT